MVMFLQCKKKEGKYRRQANRQAQQKSVAGKHTERGGSAKQRVERKQKHASMQARLQW